MDLNIIFNFISYIHISLGIGLLIIGGMFLKFNQNYKVKEYFKKFIILGIVNTVVAIVCLLLKLFFGKTSIMSIAPLFAFALFIFITIGYLFILTFMYMIKSDMKVYQKTLSVLVLSVFMIYTFFGGYVNGLLGIDNRKLEEPIAKGKEFLLYDCNVDSHGEEKVYMTINDIKKDKNLGHVMFFDLRYEGDSSIPLEKSDRSFSDISKFYVTASSKVAIEESTFNEFIIEEDLKKQGDLYKKNAEKLTKTVEPGDVIKDLALPIVTNEEYNDIDIKDIDFELKTGFILNHDGKNIKEKFNI